MCAAAPAAAARGVYLSVIGDQTPLVPQEMGRPRFADMVKINSTITALLRTSPTLTYGVEERL